MTHVTHVVLASSLAGVAGVSGWGMINYHLLSKVSGSSALSPLTRAIAWLNAAIFLETVFYLVLNILKIQYGIVVWHSAVTLPIAIAVQCVIAATIFSFAPPFWDATNRTDAGRWICPLGFSVALAASTFLFLS